MSEHIAIAGAGIGGLCSALALAKRGFKVTVLEQAAALNEVGAGLQLSPNAMQVLNALGLTAKLQSKAFSPHQAVMRHYQNGKAYFSVPLAGHCERRYGASYWHIHRADLQQALYQACIEHQVDIQLASQLISYQQSADQVSLLLADQQQFEAKVLIGADGIHSKVQATLLANTLQTSVPQFTGQVAWRGTVKTSELPPNTIEPSASLWVGPGKHFVSYYVRGGAEINFVAVEERSNWQNESWSQQGNIAELRELFKDWHPQVREILAATRHCFVWALFDREPLSAWVDGNVALLGDACHPMLPFLAQGAAMAIEDAYVLAAMLRKHSDTQTALKQYQHARLPRTTQIQLGARQNASLYHMSSTLQRAKLLILAGLSGSGISNWLAAKKLDKLYAYKMLE